MKQLKFASALALTLLVLLSTTSEGTPEAQWIEDFDTAKVSALDESKVIMMSFQGSDWCAACRRLEKSLFQNSEFIEYASSNLILLKVDFPMKKANKLSKEQTAHNDLLAEKYNPEGSFPKVIFLNAKGEVLGTLDHPKEDVASYLTSIKAFTK